MAINPGTFDTVVTQYAETITRDTEGVRQSALTRVGEFAASVSFAQQTESENNRDSLGTVDVTLVTYVRELTNRDVLEIGGEYYNVRSVQPAERHQPYVTVYCSKIMAQGLELGWMPELR